GVGKAESEDVLDRLLAQIVIYPIDLILLDDTAERLVELLRACQVTPEGLLDDEARPAFAAAVAVDEAVFCQVGDDGGEESGGGRQIENAISATAVLRVHLAQPFGQLLVARWVFKVADEVVQGRGKLVPELRAEGQHLRRILDLLAHLLAETGVLHRRERVADHGEAARQQLLAEEVIKRRNQLAPG